MKTYKVIKSLNWLNETDTKEYSTYADAMAFVSANREYILGEFSEETGAYYDVEAYQWDIEHDQHISKYRLFFLDYDNGKIDWEFEILEMNK